MRLKILSTVVALGIATFGGAATAATCNGIDFVVSQQGTFLTPTGCGAGNDEGNSGFGTVNGWTLGDSVGGGPGNGNVGLLVEDTTWEVTNFNNYSMLALGIKQSTGFAFFELDMAQTLFGNFSTVGPGDSQDDYSHINIWYKGGDTPPPSEVPLPAAGWLLIAGMGGLSVLRRKKR